MTYFPYIAESVETAVGASSAEISLALAITQKYIYTANVGSWICQGIADTVFTAASSVFTATGNSLMTGEPVQLTASGSLPTGLSAATTYYAIILVPGSTFQLATSYANAVLGTAITTSSNGSGTLTAKTVATAGAGSMFVPANTTVLVDAGFHFLYKLIGDLLGFFLPTFSSSADSNSLPTDCGTPP